MLDELTKNLTPRILFLLLLAVAVLIVSTGNTIWFKKQIKDYRQLQAKHKNMQEHPSDLSSVEAVAKQMRQEIFDLEKQLTEVGRDVLRGTKPLKVISDLGRYAKQHDVKMVGIKPEEEIRGELYTEIPFNVDLTGSYADLFKWVYSLEHSNSPLFIKKFAVSLGAESQDGGKAVRKMQLTVGLIQPVKEG